jgi:uncharacterized protein
VTAGSAVVGTAGRSLLHGVTAHRVLSVPRTTERGQRPDPNAHRPQLFATLTAAHAVLDECDGVFLTAWLRPDRGPIRIIVGGRPDPLPVSAPTAGGLRRAAYPPGAVVEDEPAVGDLLDRFPCWIACAGRPDALWAPSADRARHGAVARGSFDDVVAHLPASFAWLVVAQPLPSTAVEAEMRALRTSLPDRRARAMSESDRLDVERSESRFRELHRAAGSGVWRTSVLVGAADSTAARATAAVLCASGEFADQPYVLTPAALTDGWADGLDGSSAFAATTEFLSVLARPPARELPGLRTETPQSFDVSVEPGVRGEFALGSVLDVAHQPVESFAVSRSTLNRHAFVCGATGSGKSQTVRALLEAVSRAPDPLHWLVIEPAKAEYARMAGRLDGHGEVVVIRPGDLDTAPASLNPLEPEPGFPLQGHADLVRALFLAAFEAHEPFPQVLATALTTVYTRSGWDLVAGRPLPAYRPRLHLDEPRVAVPRRYPTLADLQTAAREAVDKVGYGAEVTADVRGFVDVRIGSLRQGAPGRFFEGGHPLDLAQLLNSDVVLELDAITNDQDKAFLMGAVLIRIVEHLRVHRSGTGQSLRHLTVIEEAHRLLRRATAGPSAAAVELFASLLAEIRAYGEGIVVVEQIPSKILPDVIKNTALKIVHRLPAQDDRDAVGGTINLQPDQSELVVALRPGTAAVAADGMDRPVLVEMPWGEHRESTSACRDVPPLADTRSALCAADCRDRPCTLDGLNDAGHLAAEPVVLLWVDLVTAAHVTGNPLPAPSEQVTRLAAQAGPRLSRCAVALAVERAVRARRDELRDYVHPADLERQVLRAVEGLLDGDDVAPEEPLRWTAGAFRWVDVRTALNAAGPGLRHPDSDLWTRRGLHLPGDTAAEQLKALGRIPGPGTAGGRVAGGDGEQSGVRASVVNLTGRWAPQHFEAAVGLAVASLDLTLLGDLAEAHFPAVPDSTENR